MTKTNFDNAKVSTITKRDLSDVKANKLKKQDTSNDSKYVQAPVNDYRKMTKSMESEEYYDVMLDGMETTDSTALADYEIRENKQAMLYAHFGGLSTSDEQVRDPWIDFPNVQKLIIENPDLEDCPYSLLEVVNEELKLVKGLIEEKKFNLKQDLTGEELQYIKKDLAYLKEVYSKGMAELEKIRVYYFQYRHNVEEKNAAEDVIDGLGF